MKEYEKFIESIAQASYQEQIQEIYDHNRLVEEAESIEMQAKLKEIKKSSRPVLFSPKNSASRAGRRGSRMTAAEPRASGAFLTSLQPITESKFKKREARTEATQPPVTASTKQIQIRKEAPAQAAEDYFQSTALKQMRFLTELFPTPDDFLDMLRRTEDECLQLIESINAVEEDISRNDKTFSSVLQQLEHEKQNVRENVDEMLQVRNGLQEQINDRMQQLEGTRHADPNHLPELNDADKQRIYGQILRLANDLGLVEKNERAHSQLKFEEAIDYLKQITFLHKDYEEALEKFRTEDKKEFERENREYNKKKRDRLREEQEARDLLEMKQQASMKQKKEEEIKRKMKGRKDKFRVWIEQDERQDHLDLADEDQRENHYFKSHLY